MTLDILPWMIAALLLIGLGLFWRTLGRYNGADWGNGFLNHLDGLNRLFCRRYHRLQGPCLELPETGPALVVANHHSGLDANLLLAASPRPLRFIIAQEEYNRFGMTWLFRAIGTIPVDRRGRPERALRAARRALEAGEVVALFPHGKIHLDSDPPRPLKPGAVYLAGAANCPIVPVRLDGVAAKGTIFRAVVRRGRVRVEQGQTIHCDSSSERHHCLERIASVIERPEQ